MKQQKWFFLIYEKDKLKRIVTNKRKCVMCGEYRKLKRISTFFLTRSLGIYHPYVCQSCGHKFYIPLSEPIIDHLNKFGRTSPITSELIGDFKID